MGSPDFHDCGAADGQDIHDAPHLTKYISALHFATTTMATVGYVIGSLL